MENIIILIEEFLSSNLEKQESVFCIEIDKEGLVQIIIILIIKIVGHEQHCNEWELRMRFVEF